MPYQVIYVYLWLTYDGCFSEETESMRVLVSHCHCLYATQVWVMHFQKFTKNSSKSAAGLSTRKMSKIAMFLFFPQSFPKQFLFWQTEPWSGLVTIGEKIKLQKQSFVPHYLSFVGIWPGCKWSITSPIKVTEVKIFTKFYSSEFDFCAINLEFRC